MPSTITVTLAGDSAPLAAALADAGVGFETMAATADAATVDIGASMDALAASMDGLQASIDTLAASFDGLTASAGTAAATVDEAGAATDTATAEALGLSDAVDTLTGAFDALMGSVTPLLATLGTLIAVMGAMTIINDVSSWIENLISQMFQLDEQTQKTVNSWQYLFAQIGVKGSGPKNAASLAGWAFQESPNLPFTAVDLRGAMSELGTSPAGTVAGQQGQFLGMSPQEVEQFLPYLADLASTLGASANGGQGTTLMQAANAIRMAQMGRSMELKSQLNITPQMLMQYGLQGSMTSGGIGVHIRDPQSLYTSIENLVNARGLRGAAQEQEINTFWGAMSSFQDYVQNFLQTVGGINPATGGSEQGSFFANLQGLLVDANKILGNAMVQPTKPTKQTPQEIVESNRIRGKLAGTPEATSAPEQPTLAGMMPILEKILGGGVESGMSLLGGIASGFGGSGGKSMIDTLFTDLKKFSDWLQSAPIQEDIKNIGKGIGEFAAQVAKLAGDALPVMMKGLGMVVTELQQFWASMSPMQRKALEGFVGDIFLVIGAIAGLVAAVLGIAAAFNTALNNVWPTVQSWGKNLASQFKQWGANFIDMLMEGIRSKLGEFGGMLNNLAGKIKGVMGFSSPPAEGPLHDADRYMPNMMMMFVEGIERGIPGVNRAAQQAAMAIGAPIHGALPHVGGGVSNTNYATSTNYGPSNSALNIYGANAMQMQMAVEEIIQKLDREHNTSLQTSGGLGYRQFGWPI